MRKVEMQLFFVLYNRVKYWKRPSGPTLQSFDLREHYLNGHHYCSQENVWSGAH